MLRVNKLINKNKKLQDKSSVGNSYSFGDNIIDFKAQEASTRSGQKIQLSKKETMLLKLLIENKNEVVPREKSYKLYGVTMFTLPPGPLIISSSTVVNILKKTVVIQFIFIR